MTTSLNRGDRIRYNSTLGRIRWTLPGQRYEIILDTDPDPLVVHGSTITAAEDAEVPKYTAYALP